MKGWRLVVGAGLVVVATLAAGPVRAEDEGSTWSTSPPPGESDTWSTVGWGVLTGLADVIYVPAKLVYAGLGGLTGGLALGLTGGDTKTAEAIWEPSLFGTYFLTPSMIKGEEPFSFAGAPLAPPEPSDEPVVPDLSKPPRRVHDQGFDS
jgi:hypothetical protein